MADAYSETSSTGLMKPLVGMSSKRSSTGVYGARSIGYLGSVIFIVNNIIGPGMVAVPQLFQRTGWVPAVVMLLVGAVISLAASAMLCETHDCLSDPLAIVPQREASESDEDALCRPTTAASTTRYSMSRPPESLYGTQMAPSAGGDAMYQFSDEDSFYTQDQDDDVAPGDRPTSARRRRRRRAMQPVSEDPQQRLEFLKIVRLTVGAFSPTTSSIIEIAYFLLLTSLNVAAIVVSAQVIDEMIIWLFGGTYAFTLPLWGHGMFGAYDSLSALPPIAITSGYIFLTGVLLPLGLLSLEENMVVQFLSFYAFFILSGVFCVVFVLRGPTASRVPAIGNQMGDLIGTTLFTYAYTMTLPSWHNERKRDVPCGGALVWATVLSTVVKVAFGWLGGVAYAPNHMDSNVLVTMLSDDGGTLSKFGQGLLSLSTYVYSFTVIGLGVPTTCVFLRYNLINLGVVSKGKAQFLASILPWLTSWTVYSASAFLTFLNYSSLLLNGVTNFIIPFVIYLAALRAYGQGPSVEEFAASYKEQKRRMAAERAEKGAAALPGFLLSPAAAHPRHPALHSYALPSFLRGRHAVTTTIVLLVISTALLVFALGVNVDGVAHSLYRVYVGAREAKK